ncbi:MAG TPA: hypothetical protein VMG10_24765 [Gemmataceae bacterium]|nr:hypothetical protein [Gemmataceae bacterium]
MRKIESVEPKTIRFIINTSELVEPVTIELMLRGGAVKQEQSQAERGGLRSVPGNAPALPFEAPAGQEGLSAEQRRVITALEEAGGPLRVKEIIAAAGVEGSYERASKMIRRLAEEGWIGRDGSRRYRATAQQTR